MISRVFNGSVVAAVLVVFLMIPAATHAASGKENYETYCVQCHGIAGKGNGVNVRDMSVQPRDHSDPKAMNGLSDDRIFKAIKEGGPAVTKSVLMPAWSSVFSDDEIRGLVAHLRVLCNCTGPNQ